MKRSWRLRSERSLVLGTEPLLMGIVNVTPDSFFEGSRAFDPSEAAARALRLLGEGAHIVDFGAESTRPGSDPVDADEEIRRLIPALREFRRLSDAPVSVDTRRAAVAEAALGEGADIINDISAAADPGMAQLIAKTGAGVVLMHMQGRPATMQVAPAYVSCAAEVRDHLLRSAGRLLEAGADREAIVLDPGIGFGKLLGHNIELIRRLPLLLECGYPVLVGLSRKRFIGELAGAASAADRLPGSLAAACAAWLSGADIFRVHDVEATRAALTVFAALNPRPDPIQVSGQAPLAGRGED